jgi:N-ethylmaleimide reductase
MPFFCLNSEDPSLIKLLFVRSQVEVCFAIERKAMAVTASDKHLFTEIRVGEMKLKHRVVMPATSRLRAQWPSSVPSELMLEYYTQRASDGGLIIAESSAVSPAGRAYHTGPGLYSEAQVTGWRRITDAVHRKGSSILAQITHAGRATSSEIIGVPPVSASVDPSFWADKAIVVSGPNGFTLPSEHRSLEVSEISEIVDQFSSAAQNAKLAGFDGVEILAGQGHLVEQFLQDRSNKRTDLYGGSIENRERFLIEVLGAVVSVLGAECVGVRISPSSTFSHMGDSNPRAFFNHLAERLNSFGLAYLHIIEPRISGADTVSDTEPPIAAEELGKYFHGPIIAAGGFTAETAERAIRDGLASLIAFGRFFTSNPDLPFRLKNELPLTPYDRSTFYAFDAKGYTDFPVYDAAANQAVEHA